MVKQAGRPSKKATSQSLVVRAYETIKERIISLHFLPGSYLNEATVCAQLGLSRTPVHQALQRLSLEGLVEVLPRKGIVIRPDSISATLEILDSRATVEPALARKAAERVKNGEIDADQVEHVLRLATATDPKITPPDIATFTFNDRAFHHEFAALSGNRTMCEFAQMLHERSTRFWYLSMWQTVDVAESNAQHASIAKAIASGDPEGAAAAAYSHINCLRDRLRRLRDMTPERTYLQRAEIPPHN